MKTEFPRPPAGWPEARREEIGLEIKKAVRRWVLQTQARLAPGLAAGAGDLIPSPLTGEAAPEPPQVERPALTGLTIDSGGRV